MNSLHWLWDVPAALAVAVANVFCLRASDLVMRCMLESDCVPATRWAGQLLMLWSSIVAASLMLGFVGWLMPWLLYLVVFGIWAGLAWWSRSAVWYRRTGLGWQPGSIGSMDIVGLENGNAGGPPSRQRRQDTRSAPPSGERGYGKRLLTFAWLLLAAVGITQVVQSALITLPHDWDTLAYHLPLVDSWIQTGSLSNDRVAFWYVPGNNELLAFWFSGLFSGDYWAQLNNVPIVLLMVFSMLGIMDHFDVTNGIKVATVAGTVGCIPVLRQLGSAENDIAVGALFLAGILFGLKLLTSERRDRSAYRWLLALVVGVLAGIKYYALGYAAVLASATVFAVWLQSNRFQSAWRVAAQLSVGGIVLGAPWYLRNWWLTGSPIYPKGIEALGMPDAWAELRPDLSSSTLLLGSTWETTRMLAWAWLVQAGPWLSLCVVASIPIAVIGILYRLRHRRAMTGELGRVYLLAIVCGAVAIYLITPNVIETDPGSRNMLQMQYHPVRFGFAMAVVASLVVAIWTSTAVRGLQSWGATTRKAFDERLGNHGAACAVGMLIIIGFSSLTCVLTPQYGLRREMHRWDVNVWAHPSLEVHPLDWLLLTVTAFLVGGTFRELWLGFHMWVTYIALGVTFVIATPLLAWHWHGSYEAHFRMLTSSNLNDQIREAVPDDAAICVCEYRFYPTIGSYRQRSVWRPLFLHSAEEFRRGLERREIALVVVRERDSHWSKAYRNAIGWMEDELSDRYELVSETVGFKLFRSKRYAAEDGLNVSER